MSKKFLVLSHARSGSTWLINTLNNIPGVTCYGEMFLGQETMYQDNETRFPRFLLWRKGKRGTRPFLTMQYLDHMFSGLSGEELIGFKLMYPHLKKYPEILFHMLVSRPRVIHLIRRNSFESVISSLVAKHRGKHHFRENESLPEEQAIRIDPKLLIRKIGSFEQKTLTSRRLLKLMRFNYIEVHYEDLATDILNFRPVWDFLKVNFDESPPVWQLKKSRKKKPAEAIVNFPEVEEALIRAGYEHFLDG